ncbi:extracellular solute-binding protein [Paenibacillus psychroresistens]|uniref:Extracellular solute-binding protein n=1 Tax=Paenibacillus psychroresistens TaxID=1778678 RepID=A0A6B8RJH9_9BACL|nr:extracellular solute-binding protein [Paenibacillus psychroresistens]QGQ95713.1 extracellular solute-binding protein [Paenibacillus psychroresistens]
MNKTVLLIMVLSLFIVGCEDGLKLQPKHKVTLVFTTFLKMDEFETLIADPVEKHFPGIKLKYEAGPPSPSIAEQWPVSAAGDIRHTMVGAGSARGWDVDYIPTAIPEMSSYTEFPAENLTPYIQKYQFDIGSIDPGLWNRAESLQVNGELSVLPYSKRLYALYYNKAVFKKYGVEYPIDGMTWDDVVELVRKLPSEVRYELSSYDAWVNMAYQLGISWIAHSISLEEAKTQWMEIIRLYEELAGLPKSSQWSPPRDTSYFTQYLTSYKQDEVALSTSSWWYMTMLNDKQRYFALQEAVKAGVDMDVVTYPEFANSPYQFPDRIEQALQMNAKSTHKEEAFQVMSYLLSDEHQLRNAKLGIGPVLDNPVIQVSFAAEIPGLQHRNMPAYFPKSNVHTSTKGQLVDQVKVLDRSINSIYAVFQDILAHKVDEETAAKRILESYKLFIIEE